MAISEDTIRLILDMGASGQNVDEVIAKLKQLEAAAKSAGGSGGRGGGGVTGLSYAVQDFTSVLVAGGSFSQALNSISNNIAGPTGLAATFGAAASTAANLSLAFTGLTVAIPLLTPLFGALWKAAAGGEDAAGAAKALGGLKGRVDELIESLKAARKAAVPEEAEAESMMAQFFGLQAKKPEEFIGRVAQAMAATGRGGVMMPEELERIRPGTQYDIQRARAGMGERERQLDREDQARLARERIDKENWDRAKALIDAAKTDVAEQQRLMTIAGAAPQIMGAGFVEQMRAVTPAALRQQEREQMDRDLQEEGVREGLQRQTKANAAVNKASEDLDKVLEKIADNTDKFVEAMDKKADKFDEVREKSERRMEVEDRFRRQGIPISREQAGQIAEQTRRRQATGQNAELMEMLQSQEMGLTVEEFRALRARQKEFNQLNGRLNEEIVGNITDINLAIGEVKGQLRGLRTNRPTRRNGGRPDG